MINGRNLPRGNEAIVLTASMALIGWLVCGSLNAAVDVTQSPDQVLVTTENGVIRGADSGQVHVSMVRNSDGLLIRLASPAVAVKSIQLHWSGQVEPDLKCLGDAWERAYADLGWRSLTDSGSMPWYFLANTGNHTDGYGVMTCSGAMCYWTINSTGITLFADVRCGGKGVELGTRTLGVCTIVWRAGTAGEDPFDAGVAFCRKMCRHRHLARAPIYGFNDWNSSYGHDTAAQFLRESAIFAGLAPSGPDRPFMVVDDGWQANRQNGHVQGNPWETTNTAFGSSIPELVQQVEQLNARPGLWYRPLEAWPSAPKELLLRGDENVFDPSNPIVRQRIVQDMQRFRRWGIMFVKHDFSTVEIIGKWGNQMKEHGTDDGWAFSDRTKTTAEIILDFYRAIRQGGGDDMVIDGCNTISHLSAGIFDACRIGDDTSGESWDRNWKYGVNALAFRAIQQGSFYSVDPDMVGLAKRDAIPWDKNKQWLRLVSQSGTTLFVSWKADLLNDQIKETIRTAFAAAARHQPTARPLDWMESQYPLRWKLDGSDTCFLW